MLKIKHNRTKMIVVIGIIIAIVFCTVFSSVTTIKKADEEKKFQKNYDEAISFCESLFDEKSVVLEDISPEELAGCEESLNKIAEDEKVVALRQNVKDATEYRTWIEGADKYIDENGVVKASVGKEKIDSLETSMKKLAKEYQSLAAEKMNRVKGEYNAMEDARSTVAGLFKDNSVKTGTKRKDYEKAKKKVDSLKQTELKKEFEKPLADVLAYVEKEERLQKEREEAARKAAEERRKKIAASWHRLNISPWYINQKAAGYPNGCEAAALLMAMKYKGYARGIGYSTFADNMPRGDEGENADNPDPKKGFIFSMKEGTGSEGAHWIEPSPLAAYGRSQGGDVVDASGWRSLDKLDEEIKNGNPVVIYLTWGFKDPKNYSRGVPRNLHVMVLSGYNSYTGEQEFYDPYPSSYGKNPTISKSRVEKLYKASGYRAVVVR